MAQRRAAQQLWTLATDHAGATKRVIDSGAISPLVALLGAGSGETSAAAEQTLTYLASHDKEGQCGPQIATGLVSMLATGGIESRVRVTERRGDIAPPRWQRGHVALAEVVLA